MRRRLELQTSCYEDTTSRFNLFLTRFTGFCNWLWEMHDQMVELCETVPHKTSQETIAAHKTKVEVRGGGKVGKCVFEGTTYYPDGFVIVRFSDKDIIVKVVFRGRQCVRINHKFDESRKYFFILMYNF